VVLATGLIAVTGRLAAQSDRASIVILTGQEPTLPVPTLMVGPAANVANADVAAQLFLRLADPGPELKLIGDDGFVPRLARSWERRDSLTLVFHLDPRARWHDGKPVTARDVAFTFDRARDSTIDPTVAEQLRHIREVRAQGDRDVVFTFDHAYPGQFYDATFYVQPLPAHLLADLPRDSLAQSRYVRAPIGDGPYRWGRQVAGQFLELDANHDFFLGAPVIQRVIFLLAGSQSARINLLLSGDADALANIIPPLSNIQRVGADHRLQLVPFPSQTVGYVVFNFRDPDDSSRPNPILSDSVVRQALVLALDRKAMVEAAYGSYSKVPVGPVSPMLWISRLGLSPANQDTARARALLASRGWTDHNGDGVLDRGGHPLALSINYPSSSSVRRQMALQMQEQFRRLGIQLEVRALDPPVWGELRNRGKFDLDFSSLNQDPSPSGMLQSWGCAAIGANNVGSYCDPVFDSLVTAALADRDHAADLWRRALRRVEADAPAIFMYAPVFVAAVDRRFDRTPLTPYSPWQSIWRWRLRLGAGR
jgi:peptide/nickel transport system substrate-binding protein